MTSSARAYLRLDSRIGWRAGGRPEGLLVDGGGVRLGVPGQRPIEDVEPYGSFGGRTLPTGVAISAMGRVFLADPAGRRILTYTPFDGQGERPDAADDIWPFTELWAPRPLPGAPAPHDLTGAQRDAQDPYTLVEPRDVALAPNGDLVVVDAGASRLLVLVMPSAALRRVVEIAGGEPCAIGFDAAARAYVADAALGRVHRFDPHWRRDEGYLGGLGLLSAPRAINVVAVTAPTGCDCSGSECGREGVDGPRDGSLYLLDRGAVRALGPSGREIDLPLPETEPLCPPPLTRDSEGVLSFDSPPRAPLHLDAVAVTRSGNLKGTTLALLARPKRIVLPRSGVFVTEALEGDREAFAWDRIRFEATIPDRTRLVVQTYSSDDALEPTRIDALEPGDWSRPIALATQDEPDLVPEVLVQSPAGRRIWLRIELFGDGEATPVIAAIDIHGPRRSSLGLLPAPFHQDPESARFLDRFLSFFDRRLAEITAINGEMTAHLDPYAVPAGEFLDWLGRWFDWRFLADWPESVRREMIATSLTFFRERGTESGIRRMLQWHTGLTDPLPVIIEHHRLRDRPPDPPLHIGGAPLAPSADELAHQFTLVLPGALVPDGRSLSKIRALIEAQKPAHTLFHLRMIEAGVRIGRQSSLGVDAILGPYPMGPLGAGRLGQGLQTARGGDPALGATALQ